MFLPPQRHRLDQRVRSRLVLCPPHSLSYTPFPMCPSPQLRGFNCALMGGVSEQLYWGGAGVFIILSLVRREYPANSLKNPSKDTETLHQNASQLPEASGARRVSSYVIALHGFLFSFGEIETSATPSGRTPHGLNSYWVMNHLLFFVLNLSDKRGIPTLLFTAITS